MAAISTHLHNRPFQVATTTDIKLPLRKWNHLGIIWGVSHRTAAYVAMQFQHCLVQEFMCYDGLTFQFANGQYVRVTF